MIAHLNKLHNKKQKPCRVYNRLIVSHPAADGGAPIFAQRAHRSSWIKTEQSHHSNEQTVRQAKSIVI